MEVRFGQYDGLQVEGTLKAVGTASLPIVFTGTSATPGWWDGIAITGTAVAPNVGSVLDHVVIEYGGYNFANLKLRYGQVVLSHATVRFSGDHGIDASHADGTVIEFSQIADNGQASQSAYGVRNSAGEQYLGPKQLVGPSQWSDLRRVQPVGKRKSYLNRGCLPALSGKPYRGCGASSTDQHADCDLGTAAVVCSC